MAFSLKVIFSTFEHVIVWFDNEMLGVGRYFYT